MSGEDDKTPMLHEREATTQSQDVGTHGGSRILNAYRRPASLALAVVTLILFVCALTFLVLCLIMPIFHALDVKQSQRQQHVVGSSNTSGADHHHEHGRTRRHVAETMPLLAVRGTHSCDKSGKRWPGETVAATSFFKFISNSFFLLLKHNK